MVKYFVFVSYFLFKTHTHKKAKLFIVIHHSKLHKIRESSVTVRKNSRNTVTLTSPQHFPRSPANSVLPIPHVLQFPPLPTPSLGLGCVCVSCAFPDASAPVLKSPAISFHQKVNTSAKKCRVGSWFYVLLTEHWRYKGNTGL